MLLRLIPPAPLPTILFTLTFPTLPHSLPLPASWDAHLQLLADTHLASPPTIHALDKSVAWTALLDTVTFDLATLTVTCIFIDGIREEWPLTNRCVDLLESVIRDVNRSAVEAEYEQQQQQQRDVAISREREPSSPSSSSSSDEREIASARLPEDSPAPAVQAPNPQKTSKSKKRRSLIASLMASLVPSSSFASPPTPPHPIIRPPTPPPRAPTPPPEEALACNGIAASRFLRRRARSTLVDAFRRFVIGELGARFRTSGSDSAQQPPHYALWVARSTMRRAAEEMARVIEGAMQQQTVLDDRDRDDERDGDDAGSASSMTDGSSVHTPLDCHDAPSAPPSASLKRSPFPRHSNRPAILAPEAYQAYVSLKTLHHRLHDLACRLTAHAVAQEHAAAGEAGVMEVRSRRRAWSARKYLAGRTQGGGGASMALVGLAVPARPSPLCTGWTADDIARGRKVEWERGGLMLRRARSLWDEGGERHVSAVARSREAEDVDELARDVEGRLAVGDGLRFADEHGTRVGYYEVDDDDDEDDDRDDDREEERGACDACDTCEDEECQDEDEFELNPARGTRLVELSRPTSPPPIPWSRPHPKMARVSVPKPLAVAVAAVEDDMPVSAKLPIDPDPACVTDI